MTKGRIEREAGSMTSPEEIRELLNQMTSDDFRLGYLDYVNNFITLERFASYYGLTIPQARAIIDTGRPIQAAYSAGLQVLSRG